MSSGVVVPAQLDDRVLTLLEAQLGRYQQIVSRLAGNGVQVKTWSLTATAALATVAIDRDRPQVFVAALMLVAAFWYLDVYYLALEQHFRRVCSDLAERVVSGAAVDVRELVVIAAPGDAAHWRAVIRGGCRGCPVARRT